MGEADVSQSEQHVGEPCYFCGEKMTRRGDRRSTRDHGTPRKITRWTRKQTNIPNVWACKECNESKGHLAWEEWRAVCAVRYGGLKTDFKFAGEK